MASTYWANDPALVSTKSEKQALQDPVSTPENEEALSFGERLGNNFDSFMTYVCFPEEHMDYLCLGPCDDRHLNEELLMDMTPVTGVVVKEDQHEKLGISIRKVMDAIYIYKINEDSKFAQTDLKAGMKILSINDEPCLPTVPEVIATLKLAKDTVKIVAEPSKDSTIAAPEEEEAREGVPGEEQQGALVSGNTVSFTDYFASSYAEYEKAITNMSINNMLEAMTGLEAYSEEDISIEKENSGEKLGVALMQSRYCNNIYVNHVWDNSKFAAAGLKAGVRVLRINGQQCPDSLDDTVSLLNKAEGHLNLTVIVDENFCYELDETVMMNGKKLANKVTIRMQKEKDEPIGMLLRKYEDRQGIFVRRLSEDGKAAKTALKPHMKILLINGQRCPENMEDCTQMISNIEGELKIVAVSNIPEELMEPVDA